MKGRLLLFNLLTDVDHPVLGFTTQWIRALAERVSGVEVITMRMGRLELPRNVRVHSLGAERDFSEPRRVLRFYRLLQKVLNGGPVGGCFSHMAPEFSVLAGPVLRAKGIPLVTWYAHPKLHWKVKLAHLFSHQMVSSLPNSYPWRKDKFTVIGQGIDTELFSPGGVASEQEVLCVGRLSPVKSHATLLRAMALLPLKARLRIVGKATGPADERNVDGLLRLMEKLGLQDRVSFEPPVAPAELVHWYRRCALHVNLTPAGFGDKVAWEAMACGRPCLVANEDFAETLGSYAPELLFKPEDHQGLAHKIGALLVMSAEGRAQIGAYLRRQVQELHSLPKLADRILEQIRRFSV